MTFDQIGHLPKMHDQFAHLLKENAQIELHELNASRLLNRVDTKFLLTYAQLWQVLQNVIHHYRVLTIQDLQMQHYSTLYFDTPDFSLYLQHHNGMRGRYKVRCRRYEDSDLAFLEIKQKTNKNRTVKNRIAIEEIQPTIAPAWAQFLQAHYPGLVRELEPKVWNRFTRMTLVGIQRVERITLDMGIQFQWQDKVVHLPGVAIAEVKQAKHSRDSAFVQALCRLNIQAGGISKYCTGAARLYPGLKQNLFKEKLLRIKRLTKLNAV